jgi:hypothetical protein
VAGVVVALGVLTAVLMPASFSAEARLLPLGTGVYDTREANGPPQPGQVLDPTRSPMLNCNCWAAWTCTAIWCARVWTGRRPGAG